MIAQVLPVTARYGVAEQPGFPKKTAAYLQARLEEGWPGCRNHCK
jgi:hypothetical protein